MTEPKYCEDGDTWVQWADHTYSGAITLFRSDNPMLWFSAAILGHQALEMYLKAALIRQGHRVTKGDVWGHDLVCLARRLLSPSSPQPNTLEEKLQVFTDYFNELRYPTELLKVSGLGESEADLLQYLVQTLRPLTDAKS